MVCATEPESAAGRQPPMAVARMKPLALRWLTEGEQALVRAVFGAGVRHPERVRILAQPVFPRPFTPGSAGIVYPVAESLTDFAHAPLPDQATFVHEMTHVWQAQHGVLLPLAKLRAGDSDAAYRYDLDRQAFPQMNIEQQARVVEHHFVLQRQETLLTGRKPPFAAERYEALRGWWFTP
jgi:hypothetical protein